MTLNYTDFYRWLALLSTKLPEMLASFVFRPHSAFSLLLCSMTSVESSFKLYFLNGSAFKIHSRSAFFFPLNTMSLTILQLIHILCW